MHVELYISLKIFKNIFILSRDNNSYILKSDLSIHLLENIYIHIIYLQEVTNAKINRIIDKKIKLGSIINDKTQSFIIQGVAGLYTTISLTL